MSPFRSFFAACLLGLAADLFAQGVEPAPSLLQTVIANTAGVRLPGAGDMRRDKFSREGWADDLIYFEWRVQRNVVSGEFRLLDPDDTIQKHGTFEECRKKLQELRKAKKLPKQDGKVVVVVHGLGGMHLPNLIMADALRKAGDWRVVTFRYASRHGDIGDHAQSLARVIENLDEASEIHFVAHSMGNLVIRRYWFDHTDVSKKETPDARIKRIVMVGPPNQGAVMARYFALTPKLVEKVQGISGLELCVNWAAVAPKLAVPTCEFGIIAGGRNDDEGWNPLLPGDDDTLVCVSETKLPGSTDFVCLKSLHALQMADPAVQDAAMTFLRTGKFPIAKAAPPVPGIEVVAPPLPMAK